MNADKSSIRARIRALKCLLSTDERQESADSVFAKLERMAEFVSAERVLMYHSLPDELPTHAFLEKWGATKRFYLPRVNGVNLELLPYDRFRLAHGAFHIEEPQGDDVVAPDTIDLIVVPGVAYDRSGNRLGRGKGFYDRLLRDLDVTTVGVAFDCQLVDGNLPVEPDDIPVNIVITPCNTLILRRR